MARIHDAHELQSENERLRQAVEELSVVNEIVTAIGTHHRVDRINQLILQSCIRHFGVEQGVIHLLDPTDPEEMLKTGVRVRKPGFDDQGGDGRFRLGITLLGWMLKHQQTLCSDDLAADPRFPGAAAEIPHVRSVLAVPLRVHNRLLGILSLFNKRGQTTWTEGDRRLLGIIALQSAQVIESARLQEMEEDLRAARSIQEGLLPKSLPVIEGLDLFGSARPAFEVGGDYYDWFPLPDGKLGCVVADVSGKGMPAALLMAHLQAAFRAQLRTDASPAHVVSQVNEQFGHSLDPDRFVTAFYAVIDPGSRTLSYASAGHNPPLLWSAADGPQWLMEGGLPLNRISRTPYSAHAVPFRPGDVLVVYTDGVTEAATTSGELWARDRLRECVMAGPPTAARDIGERILRCVDRHSGTYRQTDDITLAVIYHRA